MWRLRYPLRPNFSFLSSVSPVINLHNKFVVSSSNRFRDNEGVPKFQKQVTWPLPTYFLLFVVSAPGGQSAFKIWGFSTNHSRDMEEVLKFQNRPCDPFPTHLALFFLFLSLVPPVINLHNKYVVSSSNRSRDNEGVPKISKVGNWPLPDPLWPIFHCHC